MERLERPRGKLKGMSRRRKRLPLPERRGELWGPGGRDADETQVAVWGRALGSERLAKRLLKLQQDERFRLATLPELVALDWLRRRGIGFTFQPGRVLREASPPDILVHIGFQGAMAWQVHGQYWHRTPDVRARDMATQLLLPGQMIQGRVIGHVVELWEGRLIDKNRREAALSAALGGIGLGA